MRRKRQHFQLVFIQSLTPTPSVSRVLFFLTSFDTEVGVHPDPLRDGFQRFALGEPVGDLHPLLESEMLPMCWHMCVLPCFFAGKRRTFYFGFGRSQTYCGSAASNGLNYWKRCD